MDYWHLQVGGEPGEDYWVIARNREVAVRRFKQTARYGAADHYPMTPHPPKSVPAPIREVGEPGVYDDDGTPLV